MMAAMSGHDDVDVPRFLELGCRYFDVELGIFLTAGEHGMRIDAMAGEIVRGPADGDREAWSLSIEGCDELTSGHAGQSAAHLQMSHGCVELHTALTVPVQAATTRSGTLCFADRLQRSRPYDSHDRQVLQFMAAWLANTMETATIKRSYEKANQQLSTSEERYRSLYEKTPAILHSIDEQGRLVSVSDAWLATMGYERDDVIGRPSTDFLTPDSRQYAQEVVLPAYRATGECSDIAYEFVTKDGEIRDILLSATTQTRNDGSFFRSLAVLLDVTERRRMEQMLAGQTAALERANADLVRLAQIASHDLQEPLRHIIGYCELLMQDHRAELSEDAAKVAETIQSGGRRLRLIIDDLITYIRVKEQLDHPFEPVDMFAVLHQTLEDLNADIVAVGARVDVTHLPLVWGRPPLLKMVFHHLLTNALRHGRGQAAEINVAVEDADSFWQFALSDRGLGVESRHADRIFEILQRLHHKDEREGSGTGLAICRLIIERCGGKIWLDQTYSEGARFLFTLPKDKPCSLHRQPQDALLPTSSRAPAQA